MEKLSKYCIKKIEGEIKDDPERLIEYNNRSEPIRDEAEKVKTTESGNDQHNRLVRHMKQHEEKMMEKAVVQRTQERPNKAPKSPEFNDTESDESSIDEAISRKTIQRDQSTKD